jgi:2,4-dienoyl-CoA reductase (NADPH2)
VRIFAFLYCIFLDSVLLYFLKMTNHEPFAFKSSEELLNKAEELGVQLPFQESIEPLLKSFTIGSKKIPNRMAVHPLEGFDSEADGSPGELTFRRYRRYAQGGSGLIWFEAASVVREGRSNPHQLWLHAGSLDKFKQLVQHTREAAHQAFGFSHDVFLVLQLTHSGRYSQPQGKPAPLAAISNPYLDNDKENIVIFSDDELERLQETFIKVARLAQEAGFDAVDIKACHGYLLHELLSAFKRTGSRFGGSFENRTRFLTEVVTEIQKQTSGLHTAARINIYDGIPYPYGFGVPFDGSLTFYFSEPLDLISRLLQAGCVLINVTMGVPAYNPHVGRPFDRPLPGWSLPEQHPLEGVFLLLKAAGKTQRDFPRAAVVGTGYSWLRQFFPHVGAAALTQRKASFIGLGRSSFAYPDALKDLIEKGCLDPGKVCICCSKCIQLMNQGRPTGCVVHDKDVYGNTA